MKPVPNAESAPESAPESSPDSPLSEPRSSSTELEPLLLRLCEAQEQLVKAIRKQARAIDRLAASNEEIVDSLAQGDEPDPDAPPLLDLAGRPLDS